jgi:signal transduction histidine kinase
MESSRRNALVYVILAAAWLLILGWQIAEHSRVQAAAQAELVRKAKDISNTLGIVLRSQRRFGGIVSRDRLESALTALVRPGELNGIAMLNARGEVVASSGTLTNFQSKAMAGMPEKWSGHSVTLMNLVDLGTSMDRDGSTTNGTAVIVTPQDFFRRPDGDRPPAELPPPPAGAPSAQEPRPDWRSHGDNRSRFTRPYWMSEEEFRTTVQKQGVHSVAIELSVQSMHTAGLQDLWLRIVIVVLATVSVSGAVLARRNTIRTSDLQIRLVRAGELNTHLREMNLAAAGLAHETRNPLNIVKGMAQMISRSPEATSEIQRNSLAIIDQADHVTAQLNEFINYSRPREVRRTAVPLNAAVHEVVNALGYDLEEKKIQVEVKGEALTIDADERLLRQALFNLLMNAIQALDAGGRIEVAVARQGASEASIEIRDNGPGVPPERREEIFKPYFTSQKNGTGLGLAVVQQIVLAHGWKIECVPNQPKGAIFRFTHLNVAAQA